MKAKEFLKKYHIIPYLIMMAVFLIVSYSVKWFRYSDLQNAYGSDAKYLYRYYTAIITGFAILATLIYYLVIIKKSSIEKIFLATCIGVGILFTLIVTPNAAADETKHMYAVSSYANRITAVEKSNEDYTYYSRLTDVEPGFTTRISARNYISAAKNMFKIPKSDQKKYVKVSIDDTYDYNAVAFLFYLPAIIGVVIARALSLGGVMTFLAARILMLLTYSFISYLALTKIKVGKPILALIMLMPTSISRAACVSEDALIHSVDFLFVAYAVNAIVSTERIKRSEAAVMATTGVILALAKGGVYIPLLLLLFAIPKANFGKKAKYGVIVGVSVVTAIVCFVIANPTLLGDVAKAKTDADEASVGYPLSYLIKHPKETIQTFFTTIFILFGRHYSEMISGGYGWLQIYVSEINVVLYSILFALAILNYEGKEYCFNKKQRTISIAASVAGILLIVLSMWLFVAPRGVGYIQGVQGRYFIPFLFIILYSLKNTKCIIKNNIDKYLIFAAFAISVSTFFDIWIRIDI